MPTPRSLPRGTRTGIRRLRQSQPLRQTRRARASDRAASALSNWTLALISSCVPAHRRADFMRTHGLAEVVDGRLPYPAVTKAWATLTDRHPDPLFGVHFAQDLQPKELGLIGYLASVSNTLDEALQRVIRFHQLLKDPSQIALVRTRQSVVVVDEPPTGHPLWPRHLAEATLGAYVFLSAKWVGRPMTPRRVRFQHARPEAAAALEAAFDCPVAFSQPVNSVEWAVEQTQATLLTADPALSRYLFAAASAEVAPLEQAEGVLLDSLRQWVRAQLPERTPTLTGAAKVLAMSPRSLQRALSQRGRSFEDVLDEVRHEAAAKLLADPFVTRSEIAYLLGFSDSSGLRRALRRWRLETPS